MLSGFFLYSLNLTVAVFIFLTTTARTQVVTGNFSPSRRIVGICGTLTVLEGSCLFGFAAFGITADQETPDFREFPVRSYDEAFGFAMHQPHYFESPYATE